MLSVKGSFESNFLSGKNILELLTRDADAIDTHDGSKDMWQQ